MTDITENAAKEADIATAAVSVVVLTGASAAMILH
jgi:hypothetical protein